MSGKHEDNRPMSPYMFGSLYRWQISSVTSSIHRITGVALFFSFAIICLWIVGITAGGGLEKFTQWLVQSWLGKLVLILSLWALWYHFLNGIRHLAWDFGKGFELNTAYKTGIAVIIGSVVMTIITLVLL